MQSSLNDNGQKKSMRPWDNLKVRVAYTGSTAPLPIWKKSGMIHKVREAMSTIQLPMNMDEPDAAYGCWHWTFLHVRFFGRTARWLEQFTNTPRDLDCSGSIISLGLVVLRCRWWQTASRCHLALSNPFGF